MTKWTNEKQLYTMTDIKIDVIHDWPQRSSKLLCIKSLSWSIKGATLNMKNPHYYGLLYVLWPTVYDAFGALKDVPRWREQLKISNSFQLASSFTLDQHIFITTCSWVLTFQDWCRLVTFLLRRNSHLLASIHNRKCYTT